LSEGDLVEFLLLAHPALALLRTAAILLIELSIQVGTVGLAGVIASILFCVPPILTPLLFLLDAVLDVFVLDDIAFLVEFCVVAGDVVLVGG
jgi:hypothetical protein